MFDFTDDTVNSQDRAYLFGVQRARNGHRRPPHSLTGTLLSPVLGQEVTPHHGHGWCECDSYAQGIEDADIWDGFTLENILATVHATRQNGRVRC